MIKGFVIGNNRHFLFSVLSSFRTRLNEQLAEITLTFSERQFHQYNILKGINTRYIKTMYRMVIYDWDTETRKG